jgi:hypothetical protein
MHLTFDIFQGIGIAAALGIRPFLPAVAAGGLAAGDVEIHFKGTDYSFLQGAPFLAAVAVAAIMLAVVEMRWKTEEGPAGAMLGAAGAALGALFFAGSLSRGHYTSWPGLVGGVICAGVAVAAILPLLRRVRRRLDATTAATLPVYAEGVALLFGVLSVVAPPVGIIGLLLLIWLLLAGRGQEGQKYAGLRILK